MFLNFDLKATTSVQEIINKIIPYDDNRSINKGTKRIKADEFLLSSFSSESRVLHHCGGVLEQRVVCLLTQFIFVQMRYHMKPQITEKSFNSIHSFIHSSSIFILIPVTCIYLISFNSIHSSFTYSGYGVLI